MKRVVIATILIVFSVPSFSKEKKFRHPWQGCRVAYFGDSVTDGNVNPKTKYWSFLQQWLDITPLVYAFNGRQWNDIPRQTDKLKEEQGDKFDAIMIMMGTNDYNSGVPIGTWYDETSVRVEAANGEPKSLKTRMMRELSLDGNTYRGRINIAMKKLKELYPTKQIVLLTPLHRGYACFGKDNVQPDERYQNSAGIYLDAYIESVKEAGQVWAVPVIDIANVSGLLPAVSAFTPFINKEATDRLHPSQLGHERIAQALMYQLLSLPCSLVGDKK